MGGLFAKPGQGRCPFVRVEVADLCLDEMPGQLWSNGEKWTVRDRRNFTDEAMVVADEAQVGDKRSKAIPTGKRRGLDHDPAQLAVCLDVRIDDRCERGEIARLERAVRPKNEKPFVAQQFMIEHAITYLSRFHRRYTTPRV